MGRTNRCARAQRDVREAVLQGTRDHRAVLLCLAETAPEAGPVRFALVERSARRQERTAEAVLELVLTTGERLRIGTGVDDATLAHRVGRLAGMIHLPASVRVYLCLTPCDMRKSFDGLHALVREHLELDAFAGHLFVFASRRKRSRQDPVLGPGRIRDVEQSAWRRVPTRCRSASRRRGASARDHSPGVRRVAERNRSAAGHAAQALSARGHIKHFSLSFSFFLES